MYITEKSIPARELVEELEVIIQEVSKESYGGNVILKDWSIISAHKVRFTLRTKNSRAFGSRTSWNGKHTPAASWEAFRDVLALIFARFPNARIQTSLAIYKGKEGFLEEYPKTAHKNIGSQMAPCTMPDCTVYP